MASTPVEVASGSGGSADEQISGRMRAWRRGLIDLSYRNRLIKYAPHRASTLVIDSPSIDVLLADIGRPTPWDFYFPPDPDEEGDDDTSEAATLVDEAVMAKVQARRPPRTDEIVVTEPHPRKINRALENL